MVSIIITTKNEERHIGSCLKSLKNQTYKNTEIILVDNNSVDRTKEIARSFEANIYNQGPERSAQRNYGASKAKGKYLLFLDADMMLTSTVIRDCVNAINEKKPTNSGFYALVIPERSIGIGFWASCKALERSFYEGVDWMEAARFYRKEVFRALSGYDETIDAFEDYDLPQRLKAQHKGNVIGRIDSYIIHDEGNLTLSKTLKKKYYYGKWMRKYLAKIENRTVGMKQRNLLARYGLFFNNMEKILRAPIVFIGMLFMKSFEFLFSGLGYIVEVYK